MSLRSRIDPFTLLLLATVALASLLPVQGRAAAVMDVVTNAGRARRSSPARCTGGCI